MKKVLLTVLLFFVTLHSAAVSGFAQQKEEVRSDTWLAARLSTAILLNRHLNPFEIDSEVENGVAVLRGTVDDDIDRKLAEEVARSIDGIQKVSNLIEVEKSARRRSESQNTFYRTLEDATVTASVKSKLLMDRHISGMNIDVDTDAGVVTLTGAVESDAARDLAEKLTENTDGVVSVNNELRVEQPGNAGSDQAAMKQ